MLSRKMTITVVIATLCATLASAQTSLGSGVTYQGQLRQAGAPATGSFPMVFTLWDAATEGTQVGPMLIFDGTGSNPPPVDVIEGLFTVELDFGGDAYNGDARWLEITIDGTTLAPRQALTAAPYAVQTRGIFVNETGDRVGIGTTTPKQRLHNTGDYYGRGHVWLHANEGDRQSGTAYLQARDDSGSTSIGMEIRTQQNGGLRTAMSIAPSGTVSVGNLRSTSNLQIASGSEITFPDGTNQTTAYRPIIVNAFLGTSATVPGGGQIERGVSGIAGAMPGMTVIVNPPYRLWPFHTIGYAYVESPGFVVFSIVSTGGGDRVYGAGTWRITILPSRRDRNRSLGPALIHRSAGEIRSGGREGSRQKGRSTCSARQLR